MVSSLFKEETISLMKEHETVNIILWAATEPFWQWNIMSVCVMGTESFLHQIKAFEQALNILASAEY